VLASGYSIEYRRHLRGRFGMIKPHGMAETYVDFSQRTETFLDLISCTH
ncbi:MAG: hypothetical protein ACJAX5_002708, partial [Patiriisocius sp.]